MSGRNHFCCLSFVSWCCKMFYMTLMPMHNASSMPELLAAWLKMGYKMALDKMCDQLLLIIRTNFIWPTLGNYAHVSDLFTPLETQQSWVSWDMLTSPNSCVFSSHSTSKRENECVWTDRQLQTDTAEYHQHMKDLCFHRIMPNRGM